MRISVIGCGYLGAVHAASMTKLGHDVVGLDVDSTKVDSLAQGRPPFFEPGLPALLEESGRTGRLTFTTDPAAVAGCRVHFVCVGTPQKIGENAADLTFVDGAIEDLLPHLAGGDVVVGKSTVPVGTAAKIADRVEQRGARLLWNPEFLREGLAVQDTLHPDRLVYGIRDDDDTSVAVLDEVYASLLDEGIPRLTGNLETAELVKVAANSFLATKISFINAMAELCEAAGADVTVLADAIGHDDRIGRKFLNAGLGFGGGCLPKDIRAFMARAGELGVDQALTFLREVDTINLRRRERTVSLAREKLGGSVRGRRIAVLGAAFKPNSDDIRDSPALDVATSLQRQGAHVIVTDPEALDNARIKAPDLQYEPDHVTALAGAELVLLLTEWPVYRDLDPAEAGAWVARRRLIDARNVLDPAPWREAGWDYRGLGRS